MQKDFDKWNKYKKTINDDCRVVNFHEREIWLCSIGINIGSEQDSYSKDFCRPVVILKKFTKRIFWGIPLTTKIKKGESRISIMFRGIQNNVLILNMRSFDSRRLITRIGTLEQNEYQIVVALIVDILTKSTKTPSSGVFKAEAKKCVRSFLTTDPSSGSSEAEANVVKIRASSHDSSIENQKILSTFFGDRYLYRLTISSRI